MNKIKLLMAVEKNESGPGLPDGLFFKPKIPIWVHFGAPYLD
jgi:hypothetical protein